MSMKRQSLIWALPAAAFLLLSGGCSNTVRYLTTIHWQRTPPGAAAPGAPGDGAAGGTAVNRALYVTCWEGTCSSGILGFGRGCSLGDSKIRRCNVNPDNSLACVDEAEATQAFARQK
jgi:hypothetical protein